MSSTWRKRKRPTEDGNDAPVGQVLPVATGLGPGGEIRDGSEYLFKVRLDAMQLPAFTAVPNPFFVPESGFKAPVPRGKHIFLPSDNWKNAFFSRFSDFRANVKAIDHSESSTLNAKALGLPGAKDRTGWHMFIHGRITHSSDEATRHSPEAVMKSEPIEDIEIEVKVEVKPEDIDFDNASTGDEDDLAVQQTLFMDDEVELKPHQYIFPNDASSSDGGTTIRKTLLVEHGEESIVVEPSEPPIVHEPTLALMRRLSKTAITQIILYYTQWLAESLSPSDDPNSESYLSMDISIALTQQDAKWLFALLAHHEKDLIGAGDISALRSLARTCCGLVRRSHVYDRSIGHGTGQLDMERERATGRTGCWIVVAAIATVWGQADLWDEANDVLHTMDY